MVLGLIDFLLGGKKSTKVPKNAKVASPVGGGGEMNNQTGISQNNQVPDGQSNVTQNAQTTKQQDNELQFQDSSNSDNSTNSTQTNTTNVVENKPNVSSGNKKSVSEILKKITTDIKEINDNIVTITGDMKEVQNNVSSIDHRVSELENSNKQKDDKLKEVDDNMNKFLSLYEIVNNQYNPFIDKDTEAPKKVVVGNDGNTLSDNDSNSNENNESSNDSLKEKLQNISSENSSNEELNDDSSLLELDTINLDEAAANAVPLTNLKTNTNSLVIILSWLEYLVKKSGVENTKKTLTYYTETLKWITPEVYFELDKFLRGMDDIDTENQHNLNVRDHIVSLYFISKLNEKKLDDKLTKAVLQIIKEK